MRASGSGAFRDCDERFPMARNVGPDPSPATGSIPTRVSGKALDAPETWQARMIAPFGLSWDLDLEIETMCKLTSACCEKPRD